MAPRFILRGFSSSLVSAFLSSSDKGTCFASLSAKQPVATHSTFIKFVVTVAKRPFRLLAAFAGRALNSINFSDPKVQMFREPIPGSTVALTAMIARALRQTQLALRPSRWTAFKYAAAKSSAAAFPSPAPRTPR
ncbi:hypothetical protein [Sphingobium sp. TomTYG45]